MFEFEVLTHQVFVFSLELINDFVLENLSSAQFDRLLIGTFGCMIGFFYNIFFL